MRFLDFCHFCRRGAAAFFLIGDGGDLEDQDRREPCQSAIANFGHAHANGTGLVFATNGSRELTAPCPYGDIRFD